MKTRSDHSFTRTRLSAALTLALAAAAVVARPAPAPGQCCGDCNGDGQVAINELVTAVNQTLDGCSSDPQPEREERVREVVGGYFAAFNSDRADSFDRWAPEQTTEDWSHINPYGGSTSGRGNVVAELTFVHSTFLRGVTDTVDDLSVRFPSADLAVVVTTGRLSAYTTPDGVTHENEQQRKTFVVVNRGGRWLILHQQFTGIVGG